MNILFLCTEGKNRSVTGADLWDGRTFGHEVINTRSAGTIPGLTTTLSEDDADWADVVVVAEDRHLREFRRRFPQFNGPIAVLDIEDDYLRDDPVLCEMVDDRLPVALS